MVERRSTFLGAVDVWYPVSADVLALHDGMMRGLGQNSAQLMAGGRDKLDGALARPRWAVQYAEADLCEQASLLALGIAQAHAFVDNNKRLSYMVAVIFLRKNGRPIAAEQALAFAHHIAAGVEQLESIFDIGNWIRTVTATDAEQTEDLPVSPRPGAAEFDR
jgi:death-on-curing family protein